MERRRWKTNLPSAAVDGLLTLRARLTPNLVLLRVKKILPRAPYGVQEIGKRIGAAGGNLTDMLHFEHSPLFSMVSLTGPRGGFQFTRNPYGASSPGEPMSTTGTSQGPAHGDIGR